MTADVMVENVKESGHPKVRGIGALNRGFLKRKGGRCTTNFNAESSKAELLFRTIQYWCEELTPADTRSNALEHGEIRREGERSVISKVGTARRGLFSTDTKEQ